VRRHQVRRHATRHTFRIFGGVVATRVAATAARTVCWAGARALVLHVLTTAALRRSPVQRCGTAGASVQQRRIPRRAPRPFQQPRPHRRPRRTRAPMARMAATRRRAASAMTRAAAATSAAARRATGRARAIRTRAHG
jgi:hypothetical protein